MEAYTQQLLFGISVGALTLLAFSVHFYLRAKSLKRKYTTINAELKKTPVSALVQKLSEQKMSLERKVAKGRSAMARLTEIHTEADKKVQKIKAGLPPPNFKVDDDEDLKSAIRDIRSKQYRLIDLNDATRSLSNWEWFGSKSDGNTLIQNYNKLMVGALNAEVDMARSKMRHGSFDTAINKLEASVKALEKLAETVHVEISPEYLLAKEEELKIWHADLLRRHEEKEARKHQKALLREQNQTLGRGSNDDEEDEEVANELEACAKELARARELARQIAGDDLAKLELKITQIEEEKRELEAKFERATSQAQITRAGYLYVISNIGSFGEGICKIGMTRRLEPMDRVVELGDASVPYRFDVHTLAFVEDAPRLEKEIHRALSGNRVNRENHRKEFFHVSPEDAKAVMSDLGIKSSWFYDCEAKEYRESELMREALQQARRQPKEASSELPESV
jgi:Meiotically Up-regulated Gene 113 (MUG113) protein/uncharacterized protein DUF4041